MELEKSITQKIEQISPDHKVVQLPQNFKKLTQEVSDFIEKNHKIHRNQKKYDLHWAFDNSQQKMNRYFEDFAVKKIQSTTEMMKKKNCNLCDKFVCRFRDRRRRRLSRRMRVYSITSFLVTLVDVVLSSIMVLIISELGHFGEGFFHSGVLALLFVVFVALFKVSLDKFYITPLVHRWGWRMFGRINQTFQKNISTALAVLFVLEQLTNEKNSEAIPYVIKSAEDFIQLNKSNFLIS